MKNKLIRNQPVAPATPGGPIKNKYLVKDQLFIKLSDVELMPVA